MSIDPDSFSALNRLRLPDFWQHEALQAMRDGQDVIVDAPTGAGKTYIFELFAREYSGCGQLVYTVPTRALANDKYMEWQRAGWNIGIATGDVAANTSAPVLVATLETQRERLLRGDGPALLVVDEYQMLADPERGRNYESAIAIAPPATRLLLLSGSVANPHDVQAWFARMHRDARLVRTSHRPVPLDDAHVAGLPRHAPPSVSGFFPRLAYSVCLSDLAPLLIFAPQRAAAERIAKQIAAALPDDLPLALPAPMRAHCPADLRPMLGKRVAFHHSGLPYAARAAVIEPLAKAGQRRVVVATMGLAAGINFSVRSVFVSARGYRDGPFHKEISADGLLQMFGRAGRRGLDEAGLVITADDTPRLSDARPARLQRGGLLDWPTLLRVMDNASRHGQNPLLAASGFAAALFAGSPPPLGWEADAAATTATESPSPFSHAPLWRELANARGEWERAPSAPVSVPLARCLAHVDGAWIPAGRAAGIVSALLPGGRLTRLVPGNDPARWRHGIELTLATRTGDGTWLPTRTMAKWLDWDRRQAFTSDQWEKSLRRKVLRQANGAAIWDESTAAGVLRVRLDLANVRVDAWPDSHGQLLLHPPFRTRRGGDDGDIIDPVTGESRLALPGSAVRAWRRLGLIEADGRLTTRGRITSFFQRGEGLAIAAALEDPDYPVDEILWHLANLRAGYRFADSATGESARLAIACRRAFGSLDFPGYLAHGLPDGYGDGAGELLMAWLIDKRLPTSSEWSNGDLDRARVEWLSLVRHITHAPPLPEARWQAIQASAAHIMHVHGATQAALAPLVSASLVFPETSLYLRKRKP